MCIYVVDVGIVLLTSAAMVVTKQGGGIRRVAKLPLLNYVHKVDKMLPVLLLSLDGYVYCCLCCCY